MQSLTSCCHIAVQMVLAASAALGLTINHSTFLCTQVNEPLMTSVAGNLKNVLMVRILLSPASIHSHPAAGAGKRLNRRQPNSHRMACCSPLFSAHFAPGSTFSVCKGSLPTSE